MSKVRQRTSRIGGLWLLVLAFLLRVAQGAFVGFNYGNQISNPPTPQQVVSLLKTQHITNLRLYDADAAMLSALSGTGIEVVIGVPNTQLLSLGQSNATASNWVLNNVLPYLPNTNITGVCVGSEVLTSSPHTASLLLPAITNLYSALSVAGLAGRIKVSTSHSTSLILDSFPPSQAFFNRTWNDVLQPLLAFLSRTSSYFMLNVYPYDIYKASNGVIELNYALLEPLSSVTPIVDSNNLLSYSNLFDAVLDSAFFAMAGLNYTNVSLVVSETGWPSKGGSSDTEANVENASSYVGNVIRHVVNNTGTPRKPRATINTYVLGLFNEDLKSGLTTAKNYGLFNSTTTLPLYLLRLSGSGPLLSNDTTEELYCVAVPGADPDELRIALNWACGPGHANCSAILPGDLCYLPDTVESHASYAFNGYFQMMGQAQGSCDFNGIAIVTTTNPSYGACVYPGRFNTTIITNSTGINSTLTNTTTVGNDTSSSSAVYSSEMTQMHIFFTFISLFLFMGGSVKLIK